MLALKPSGIIGRTQSLKNGISAIAILLGALVWPSGLAFAQSQTANQNQSANKANKGGFDEIIVTARKVEENIETTPITMSAVTGEMMDKRGTNDIEDISRFIPNLQINANGGAGGSSTTSNIYIRGVGQPDFLITTDPGVGIYIDGVYYARAVGSIMDLVDIDRVEVLRGPQGTLFGKNTIGGAVSIVSKKPSHTGGGQVQAFAGKNNYFEGRASFDVPMSDTLAARFSGLYKTKHGYTKRLLTGEREGDGETIAGRAYFSYTPTDKFSADLAVDYSNHNGNTAELAILQFEPSAPLAGLWQALVGAPAGIAAPVRVNTNPRENNSTGPNIDDNEIFGVGLTTKYDFGAVSLKSISAIRTLSAEFGRDNDGTPNQYLETHDKDHQVQYSQELQLSGQAVEDKLDWVLGGYYFKEIAKDTNDVRLASGIFNALEAFPAAVIPLTPTSVCPGPFPPNVCAGGAGNPFNAGLDLDFNIYNKINSESYAFFGTGSYQLNDKWRISAGLRYTNEDKSYFLNHFRVNSGAQIIPPTTVTASYNAWSPKFSLDYQASDQMFLYSSVSRGFKAGGFNGRPTSQAEVESFDPEFLWAYEVGAKMNFADRRVLLNVAAFYNDYKDIQLNSVRADATGNLLLVVENGGTAHIKGLEADLRAKATETLTFDASLGLLDANYATLNPGVTITKDLDLPRTPSLTFSVGAEQVFPLSDQFDVTVRGDYTYQSKMALDVQNTPALIQDGYGLLGARITLSPRDGNWEVSAYGKNLTNELYLISGLTTLDSFGVVEATYGLPVEWGVSSKLKF